jgi:hypothetical protein
MHVKKGSPVHVVSVEGSDHFGSYVRNISLYFYKRLFPGLEPITSLSQDNSFTAAPGLPFIKGSLVHVAPTCVGFGERSVRSTDDEALPGRMEKAGTSDSLTSEPMGRGCRVKRPSRRVYGPEWQCK